MFSEIHPPFEVGENIYPKVTSSQLVTFGMGTCELVKTTGELVTFTCESLVVLVTFMKRNLLLKMVKISW